MKTKKGILHFFAVSALAIGMLMASCVTMVPIELSGDYRSMLLSPAGNERIIDRIYINRPIPELANRRCFGDYSPMNIGATYQVPENRAGERHVSEFVLEQAINEARRRFPNETVSIRNASISMTQHSNPHQVVVMTGFDDQGQRRNQYRTAWICTPTRVTVDIITTEPVPRPVTHSDTITVTPAGGGTITASDGSIIGHIAMAQVTRGDLFRRAHNWLTDSNPRGSIEIRDAHFDLGRIIGRYIFTVNAGHAYNNIINSTFTIDVHDARAQIRFENTVLHRSVTSPAEPIFLQSIADLAHAELVTFADALISRITSPD